MAVIHCPNCDGPPLDILDRKKIVMALKWELDIKNPGRCGYTHYVYQCPECKNVEVY